ncbi:PP-loop family-domain-containing protein [Lipomyces japonicus]|uniref:PP-loop family-domain-containing protein n=1 Tax=Lipomyces japonicus TaxID=56871 RepID=UPI0034CFEA7D
MSGPILGHEFSQLLGSLFPLQLPRQLGIAVSGGVDSMALAFLLNRLAQSHNISLTAFTVDHKLRDESSSEAYLVHNELTRLGITHQILPLSWDNIIRNESSIESLARKLRYEALTQAALKTGVYNILTAHTLDDQMENFVMRMTRGTTPNGMTLIRPINGIPFASFSFGGDQLKLIRPLLNIRKERLRLTCKQNSVKWFEDRTNADPTYTFRNAVRHVLTHKSTELPSALRPHHLAPLCIKLAETQSQVDNAAKEIFDNEVLLRRIEREKNSLSAQWIVKRDTIELIKREPPRVVAGVLTRIMELVSDEEYPDIGIRELAELQREFVKAYQSQNDAKGFSKAGIDFKFVKTTNDKGTRQHWILKPRIVLLEQPTRIIKTPQVVDEWSDWVLWANRVFIRIKITKFNNSIPKYLIIKPLSDLDEATILKYFGSKRVKSQIGGLGKFTWIVPAIYDPNIARIVSVPSLSVRIPPRNSDTYKVEAELRFRKNTLPPL